MSNSSRLNGEKKQLKIIILPVLGILLAFSLFTVLYTRNDVRNRASDLYSLPSGPGPVVKEVVPVDTNLGTVHVDSAESCLAISGCYGGETNGIHHCIENHAVNGGYTCCNDKKLRRSCVDVNPPEVVVAKQVGSSQIAEAWNSYANTRYSRDISSQENFACGPFSVINIINQFTGVQNDPVTFIPANYPNLSRLGTTLEQNVAVLNQNGFQTEVLYDSPATAASDAVLQQIREELQQGNLVFVGGTFTGGNSNTGIQHDVAILGINEHNELIYADPSFNSYNVNPELFEVVVVSPP